MDAYNQDILTTRAKKLSLPVHNEQMTGQSTLVVCFLLYPERFAVEATFVDGVFPLNNLTMIPGVNIAVSGVMNVRGETYPLVNLKKLMGLHDRGLTAMDKVILLRNKQMAFGLLVDDVTGTEQIDTSALAEAPATLQSSVLPYIMGIAPGGTVLLDAKHLLQGGFYTA